MQVETMAAQAPYRDPCWSRAILDRLCNTEAASAPTSSSLLRQHSYHPTASTPRTSAVRLSQPDAWPTPFPTEPVPASTVHPGAVAPKSVLYLAYGSNLCAKTFLGTRGIRPLSQVNVSAPSLRLVFDLPGLPYAEPCFANTAPRKLPRLPNPPKMPPDLPRPPIDPPSRVQDIQKQQPRVSVSVSVPGDPVWDKGLIGVVYEVTPEDFARIVATEGGGASYADIMVPCLPIPPRMGVPEKPGWPPELPKMFLAHTLYAPRLPGGGTPPPGKGDGDGDGEDEGEGDGGDDGKWKIPLPAWMKRWAARLVTPVRRPEQDYAQPSARYLKLIRDGAREHELPDEYQRYLAELKPYSITRPLQAVGLVLFLLLFGLPFLFAGLGGRVFADERGRVPRWLAVYMAVLINVVWMTYDGVFKPVFGDGERTEEEGRESRRVRKGSILGHVGGGVDVEKRLLDGE